MKINNVSMMLTEKNAVNPNLDNFIQTRWLEEPGRFYQRG